MTGDQRPYSFAEKRHVINVGVRKLRIEEIARLTSYIRWLSQLFAKRKVDWQGIPILPLFLFSHLIGKTAPLLQGGDFR